MQSPATPSIVPVTPSASQKKYLALGDSYTIGQGVPPGERYPVQTKNWLVENGVAGITDPQIIATSGWTTTALQALTLLNGSFILQQAGFFAERVEREAGSSRVRRAFELALGRKPSESEERAAESLVKSRGIRALCRALMNANEFLFIP